MSAERGRSWKLIFRPILKRNSHTEYAPSACENSIRTIPRNEQSERYGGCLGGATSSNCESVNNAWRRVSGRKVTFSSIIRIYNEWTTTPVFQWLPVRPAQRIGGRGGPGDSRRQMRPI